MRALLVVSGVLSALSVLAAPVAAHGGTYTGPPGGGSPGPHVPAGGGTMGPNPGNPNPGGPGAPGGTTGGGGESNGPAGGPAPVRPGGGPATSRGITGASRKGTNDQRFLDWDWWWDLNDDRYLILKSRLRDMGAATVRADLFLDVEVPVEEVSRVLALQIRQDILPALRRALKDPFHDARAGAAIALGKVALHDNAEAAAAIRGLLADPDKTVRESACLALGLLGDKAAARDLLEIARNTPKGKALAGAGSGDILTRNRCFAAVAVGLIGSRQGFGAEEGVVEELVALARTKAPHHDLQVGPAIALQLPRNPESVPAMLEIFKDEDQDSYVRAQIGIALAKAGARAAVPEFLKRLEDKDALVARTCAIGLGLLVSREDREAVLKLVRFATAAPDRGVRNFCLIALGEIGDARGKALLLRNVQKGQYADATFSAVALGVMGHRFPEERADSAAALVDAYRKAKDLEKAAHAIGLALLDHQPAAELMRADLVACGSQDLKGHLCTALGLLGDRAAIPAIQELVKQKGDPSLRRYAAIGLGLLKDPRAVDVLKDVIQESQASKAVLAASTVALGFVGDRRAVPVLVEMVEDRKGAFGDVTRAFATVALGHLGDKDDIPLLSRIHENSNYLAQTEALAELLTIL